MTHVTIRTGRAFSADAPNAGYHARVETDGTVSVYDHVAGYWTTCHALTPAQVRYVRRVCAA